jgi:hypothetical protein
VLPGTANTVRVGLTTVIWTVKGSEVAPFTVYLTVMGTSLRLALAATEVTVTVAEFSLLNETLVLVVSQ